MTKGCLMADPVGNIFSPSFSGICGSIFPEKALHPFKLR